MREKHYTFISVSNAKGNETHKKKLLGIQRWISISCNEEKNNSCFVMVLKQRYYNDSIQLSLIFKVFRCHSLRL